MIILSAAPVHAYTTPWMHAPEFDGGWGLLDPSTWSDPNEWERQTALTGGWGGLRQTLRNDGIDFTGLYMMESAGNPIGGNLHKLRYTHDLGLGIYLDLDKLLGLKHTYFLVSASQRVGNNLSGDIPNFFQVQQGIRASDDAPRQSGVRGATVGRATGRRRRTNQGDR
jgi:hypothetical protein